jgi:integrase/recombinase XerD
VTHLRKTMLEELQRRHFSEHTIRYYIRTVEDFARHFNRPPDRLGPRHIREYQAELFQKRKLSPGTVAIRLAALRFFYIKTLKKSWSIAETPYPKKNRRLPTILSQKEVEQLIHAARTQRERILLMTLYATGARNAELTHLKATDIDSQRMVVHIRGGKGRKDRDVMLSPKLLTALRTLWRYYHRKSSTWLFPSNYRKDRPIDTSRPERNDRLLASLTTPSERNRKSFGCARTEQRATRRELDESATSRGGRYRPRCGRGFHRTKPPLAPLEACESTAGH